MKRARPPTGGHQRVVIDVGGLKLSTTVATIQRSSYLNGMVELAAWEEDADHCEEIFLDRDPEIFGLLLRLMRQFPRIAGLVPHDPCLCASSHASQAWSRTTRAYARRSSPRPTSSASKGCCSTSR